MKKIKALSLILIVALLLALSACGSFKRVNEDKTYQENINNFFAALDDRDTDAIKSLFSSAVIQNDTDLDEQISKLISIYPNAETEILFDGLLGGDYERRDSKHKSVAYTTFPVICDNQYFWVYFELVYEDDFCEENVGLSSVFFYTADEYCAFFHNDSEKLPNELGLLVFSDLKLERDIKPIEGIPYEFTPVERTINISDVEVFFDKNKSLTEFMEAFGQPNSQDSLWTYYYEITETDGSAKYLEIGVPDGENIEYANIIGEFEFIRSILEEAEG